MILAIVDAVLPLLPIKYPIADILNNTQPISCNFLLPIDPTNNLWNIIFKVKKTFLTIRISCLVKASI